MRDIAHVTITINFISTSSLQALLSYCRQKNHINICIKLKTAWTTWLNNQNKKM